MSDIPTPTAAAPLLLDAQAASGRVPHLAAGKRLLFEVPTVARILKRRATQDAQGVHRG